MPNRILKESICTSETVDQLGPEEEIFFYRLITACDDYGLMDARPAILRARCFPLRLDTITNADIERWLEVLVSVGLISLYTANGQPYLQMATWAKHQQIRAHKTRYPRPNGALETIASNCKQLISDDGTCPRNPIQSNPNPNPNPIQSESCSQSSDCEAEPIISEFEQEFEEATQNRPKPKPVDFSNDSEPYRLTALLIRQMRLNDARAKVPPSKSVGFQGWCKNIDLLIRSDGRDPPTIRAVITWCQTDSFWKRNILSTGALRKHFGQLYLTMQEATRQNWRLNANNTPGAGPQIQKPGSQSGGTEGDEDTDYGKYEGTDETIRVGT